MNMSIHDQHVKIYVVREHKLDDNIAKIFTYTRGQCNSGLQSVDKFNKDYEYKEDKKKYLVFIEVQVDHVWNIH